MRGNLSIQHWISFKRIEIRFGCSPMMMMTTTASTMSVCSAIQLLSPFSYAQVYVSNSCSLLFFFEFVFYFMLFFFALYVYIDILLPHFFSAAAVLCFCSYVAGDLFQWLSAVVSNVHTVSARRFSALQSFVLCYCYCHCCWYYCYFSFYYFIYIHIFLLLLLLRRFRFGMFIWYKNVLFGKEAGKRMEVRNVGREHCSRCACYNFRRVIVVCSFRSLIY